MNIKERAIKFEKEKEELERIIDQGIRNFNKINGERVEELDEQPTSGWDEVPVQYNCLENGIKITWFENHGRCGENDYETFTKLIPYEYFEENENMEKIYQDKLKREKQKELINISLKKENEFNSKRLKLEKDIRELSSMEYKYKIVLTNKKNEITEELEKIKTNLLKQKKTTEELRKYS